MSFVVAVDGPAGTGKGTVAKKIAEDLNLVYIDTGAMYRCVALEALENNIGIEEEEKITQIAKTSKIELKNENGKQQVFLNERNVTDQIRETRVNNFVSKIAAIVSVRNEMVNLERKVAEGKEVIMEGRDIGSYVFPAAEVKFYLDATLEERARRRYEQNKQKDNSATYEEALQNIKMRDEDQTKYEIGNLKITEDAIVIDTTNMTIAQVIKKMKESIQKKKKRLKQEEKIYKVRPETNWKKFERAIVKKILHGTYLLLFRIQLIGEKLPEEGAYIVCANHINYWDAVGLVTSCKRKVYFMAKEDLFYHPLLNWIGHLFDVIPIKRGKQDMESMKRALGILKKGEVLGLFPEGTRKGVEKGEKVKNGAAFMALRTNTPVIPIGIQGDFKPFKKVYLNYGKAIHFNSNSKTADKEELEKASKEIMDNIIMLTKKEN